MIKFRKVKMKRTYYDLKIYDNGMVRGVLQKDIEALPQRK